MANHLAYTLLYMFIVAVISMNQVELKQLYAEVFDTNGKVKVCGRQSCIDLIDALEYVTGTRDVWGNIQTGAMNIDKINSYFKTAA